MSNYTSSSSSRRSGSRRSGRQYRGRGERTRQSAPAPKKLTFWQKILVFLGVNQQDQPSSQPSRLSGEQKPKRPPIRKPEPSEVVTPRIYVGNLSFDATESDLYDLFNGVGSVQNVEIVCNRHTQRSKGFAFVQMQTIEEAKRAVSELHDKEYLGRKLVVSGAKALDERKSERFESQPEQ